jgi:hypothetical protein
MDRFRAEKHPDAVHDYVIDWSEVLNQHDPVDTISTSAWTVDSGGVLDSDSNTTSTTTAWLSAGTLKEIVNLKNTITTSGGRTYIRTIKVSILET